MSTLPNKYGYQPRNQWEANDLDAEAEALRKRAEEGGGNCLMVLLAGLILTASLLTGAGVALAQDEVMPGLYVEYHLPLISTGDAQ